MNYLNMQKTSTKEDEILKNIHTQLNFSMRTLQIAQEQYKELTHWFYQLQNLAFFRNKNTNNNKLKINSKDNCLSNRKIQKNRTIIYLPKKNCERNITSQGSLIQNLKKVRQKNTFQLHSINTCSIQAKQKNHRKIKNFESLIYKNRKSKYNTQKIKTYQQRKQQKKQKDIHKFTILDQKQKRNILENSQSYVLYQYLKKDSEEKAGKFNNKTNEQQNEFFLDKNKKQALKSFDNYIENFLHNKDEVQVNFYIQNMLKSHQGKNQEKFLIHILEKLLYKIKDKDRLLQYLQIKAKKSQSTSNNIQKQENELFKPKNNQQNPIYIKQKQDDLDLQLNTNMNQNEILQDNLEKNQLNLNKNQDMNNEFDQDQKLKTENYKQKLIKLYEQEDFQQLELEVQKQKNFDVSLLDFIDFKKIYEDGNTLQERFILQSKYAKLKNCFYKLRKHFFDTKQWFDYCKNGNVEGIYFCFYQSVNMEQVDEKDYNLKTGLLYACQYQQLKIVQMLVEQCQVNLNQQTRDKKTGLIIACERNYTEIARYLKDRNARLDVQDDEGQTALIKSCQKQNLKNIIMLIDAKADINVADRYGKKALNYLDEMSKKNLMQYGKIFNDFQNGKVQFIILCIKYFKFIVIYFIFLQYPYKRVINQKQIIFIQFIKIKIIICFKQNTIYQQKY